MSDIRNRASGLPFAHSDSSGYSVFEEALYWGVEAAKKYWKMPSESSDGICVLGQVRPVMENICFDGVFRPAIKAAAVSPFLSI
nr:hypothetical protein [Neisseria bergeri]